MNRNKVTVVNTYDKELGVCDKLKAHQNPILHRAFSVFLIDGNKMLLQKRALNKYHCGGLWTNACCSHPVGNVIRSAKERLNEELNINCEIKEIFNFIYYAEFKNGLFEYEFDHTFLGFYPSNKQINYNKNEISKIEWIEFEKLQDLVCKKPQIFTPWFLHACPRVLDFCRNNLDLI